MTQYTEFKVLPNGNLEINLTPAGYEEMLELYEKVKDGYSTESAFADLIEHPMCNGYSYVQPKDIGALTDSILISDTIIDEETTAEEINNSQIWFHADYMIIAEFDVLFHNKKIIFQKS